MERRRKFSRPKFKTRSPSGRTDTESFSAWYFPAGRSDPKVYREIGNRWEEGLAYQNEERERREADMNDMWSAEDDY